MWLVIRWILLPLAVGRQIHPSIDEFKRFNDGSKDFRKRRGSLAPKGGPTAPAPLSKILRPIVESLEFAN